MDILGGCGDGGVLFSIVFGFSLSMFSDLLGLRPKFGVQARYCGVGVWTATILEVGLVDGFGGVGGDILPYGCIRLEWMALVLLVVVIGLLGLSSGFAFVVGMGRMVDDDGLSHRTSLQCSYFVRLLPCPEKLVSVDTMSFGEERDRDVAVFWSPSVKWVGSVDGF
ncbi:hypothetical protein M0R45_014838 [Rubus argutus]|uniref:NADH dehydrogenase subunit 6 n=1 Tax=Rubus argutus TaxID=59490 RepID=A0AAW1XNC5_RUBAR